MADLTPTPLTPEQCDRIIIAAFEPDDDCAHNLAPLYAEVADMLAVARADERRLTLTEAAIDWRDGEWRPVLNNDAGDDLTVAGRVTKWLRARAALSTEQAPHA